MIERVEVTPGPGTVIRYGGIVIWADGPASPALISFLAQSARNLSGSIRGGRQIADHIAGVLGDRDPEPGVAFAVIGPSDHGWSTLLHGPVQLWDGARWLAPSPAPGWLQAIVTPQPAVTVTRAGSPTPGLNPDSMLDLEAGVVPGAGFLLVPSNDPASLPADRTYPAAASSVPVVDRPEAPITDATSIPDTQPHVGSTTLMPRGGEAGAGADWAGPGADRDGSAETQAIGLDQPTTVLPTSGPSGPGPDATGPSSLGGIPAVTPSDIREPVSGYGPTTATSLPAGSVGPAPNRANVEPGDAADDRRPADDRQPGSPSSESGPLTETPAPVASEPGAGNPRTDLRTVPDAAHNPLPVGVGPDQPVPGAAVVAGTLCPRGHLNRPGTLRCVRCATAISPDAAHNVSGGRPPLGILVADDGAVFRLDSAYLVGADPGRDPTVSGGRARPLVLSGDRLSASHAEIRLDGWDISILDRGSSGGTYVCEPGSRDWQRLKPFEPVVLRPGTHVAFAQRIVTFATAWIPEDGSSG